MVFQILVIALVISSIAALAPSQPTLLRRSGRYLGGRLKPKRQISGQGGGVTLAKLSTGPFAVRAIETPRVANTDGNAPRTSRKLHDNSPVQVDRVHLLAHRLNTLTESFADCWFS